MLPFNFINASISKKISSLFALLLSFLLVVIIYSIYKLNLIDSEMKEVAYVDIPLNEIMSEIEMLQLEQHILLEKFELREQRKSEDFSIEQQFTYQKKQFKSLLDKAVKVIANSLSTHEIRYDLMAHQQLMAKIEVYHQKSDLFEQVLQSLSSSPLHSAAKLKQLEDMANDLEAGVTSILERIETMTLEAGRYTEKHEQEFKLVNVALGCCALILGLILTTYIIRLFHYRIVRIKQQIQTFESSLSDEERSLEKEGLRSSQDELVELEQELKLMMRRLTKEITNREQVEQQLLVLATQDKLTGAYNRHKWDEQLQVQLNLAKRGGQFSLILLDIDFFKLINDQHGHQVGDQVLIHMVAALKERLRNVDQLFRLGGEEFAILLPLQDAAAATHLAEVLREMIEQINHEDLPRYTISIGVTEYLKNDNEESIIKRVDKALYRAKSEGRNRVYTD
ncbi:MULTISPECIES: GGDEF domain-containing protein [unclassified Agarivorans]|uniref:GGDEF domain-containing protein n=1 Tax=unclassified Agarivorans TaxID=2636026 RepID=UPI003D7CA988